MLRVCINQKSLFVIDIYDKQTFFHIHYASIFPHAILVPEFPAGCV